MQYFENNGSRAIYHDGWIAAAFGPLTPWLPVSPGLATWDANKDIWELYDLKNDLSEADNLAARAEAPCQDETAFSERGRGQQSVSGRSRAMDAPPSRGSRQGALHKPDLRRDDDATPRICGARRRTPEQSCHGRCRRRRRGGRGSLRARRNRWRPDPLHG